MSSENSSTRSRAALVVGFGAGVTAGPFTRYADIERIVVCALKPLVPRVVSTFCREPNDDDMKDRGYGSSMTIRVTIF
jgi:spermidine synthase